MSRRLNWEAARRRAQTAGSRPAPPKPRGITNAQAKELARLRRKAGVPYDGDGMTALQAARAIDEAKHGRRSPKMTQAQYMALRQAKLRKAFKGRQAM